MSGELRVPHGSEERVLGWRVRKGYKRGSCQGKRTYKDGIIIHVNQKTGQVRYISVGTQELGERKGCRQEYGELSVPPRFNVKFLHGLSRNEKTKPARETELSNNRFSSL